MKTRRGWMLGAACAALGAGCAPTATTPPPAVPTGSTAPPSYVATLRLTAGPEQAEGTPTTRVTLVMHSETEASIEAAVAVEPGACAERPVEAGELVRVACWWGPHVSTWRVRREPEALVVERRSVATVEGETRPAWEELHRQPLPAETQVSGL